MKANYIPAVVMLTAGLIDCILGFSQGLSPLDFTVELLVLPLLKAFFKKNILGSHVPK